MPRLFGTDGVRGLANGESSPPTWPWASRRRPPSCSAGSPRGRSSARRSASASPCSRATRGSPASSSRPRSRRGSPSSGVDVLDAGVIPTPAAAFLVADIGADFGVMVSASHNPAPDNGIKFFADRRHQAARRGRGPHRGRARRSRSSPRPARASAASAGSPTPRTATWCTCSARCRIRLDGLHVVLDCAHGAAAGVSPEVFTDAGAHGDRDRRRPRRPQHQRRRRLDPPRPARRPPCCAPVPTSASRTTATPTAASRSTPTATSSTATRSWRSSRSRCSERGLLAHDTLVATVDEQPRPAGRDGRARHHGCSRPRVGDRYVLEAMAEHGLSLGGEQSGHVIMTDYATTGDGILTGLQLVAEMARTGKTARRARRRHDTSTRRCSSTCAASTTTRSRDDAVIADGGRRGRARARRHRPRAAAPLRHRAARARHGRGARTATAQRIADELAGIVRERLALS